jgi:hypothetical protein
MCRMSHNCATWIVVFRVLGKVCGQWSELLAYRGGILKRRYMWATLLGRERHVHPSEMGIEWELLVRRRRHIRWRLFEGRGTTTRVLAVRGRNKS